MQQLTLLATPDGQWVLPDSPDFYAALGDPNPDYDAIAFAVKNLGFIKFQVVQRSLVEIELHPRNVELTALLAVQQQLLSSDIRLFRIKYFDTHWKSEIASSVEHVIARLGELCAPQSTPAAHDRFLVEPQDLSLLFDDDDNLMRPLAQKWRVSFGKFDGSIVALAMRSQLLSRLAIVGVKPRQPEPVWRFIGDGHRWLGGGQFLQNGLGEKVSAIPDRDYGQWASGYYRSVAESGRPRFDLITTSIQYNNEDDRPWRQIRYERLLLPWKTPSDEVFVTMCSRLVGNGEAKGVANGAGRWVEDGSDRSVTRKLAMSS